MIKVGNDSFRQTQFGPKASETISQRRWRGRHFSASGLSDFWRFFGGFVFATQRRFLPKLKVCPSSVSSTNPLAENSKLENNASDNTSLLLKCTEGIICYFTANLVVLLHVFFFLIYLFLFVLHFQCIF